MSTTKAISSPKSVACLTRITPGGSITAIGVPASVSEFLYDTEEQLIRSGPCRADVNGDGKVSSIDQSAIAQRFSTIGSTLFDVLFDLNEDNKITSIDLSLEAQEFGRDCSNSGAGTGNGAYSYDGIGLRTSMRSYPNGQPHVTTSYVWDRAAALPVVLQETSTQGGVSATTTYLWGLDLIATTSAAGATSFYLPDGLGSTAQLADAAGTVTDNYSYDAFGALRSSSGGTANAFKFTGEQNDGAANRG